MPAVLILYLVGKRERKRPIHCQPRRKEGTVPLVEIVIVLIVVGVFLWLINTYIPMAAPIKSLLNAVVVIALVVWILKAVHLWHYVTHFRVGS
jgi:hypothetical protein